MLRYIWHGLCFVAFRVAVFLVILAWLFILESVMYATFRHR